MNTPMTTMAVPAPVARFSAVPTMEDIARSEHPAVTTPDDRMVQALRAAMIPATQAEIEEAKKPYPHLFMTGRRGLIPKSELTVIDGPGREGKTYTLIGLIVAYVLSLIVGGMRPQGAGRILVLSAEDDRLQYIAKIEAAISHLGAADAEKVRQRIIVPELSGELEPLRTLVTTEGRNPIPTHTKDIIVKAIRGMGFDAVFVETASTVSDAEEDNAGFRMLAKTLKYIAREAQIPVGLTHHTSQLAAQDLPTLNISVYNSRGGTALMFNSRQNAMIVNLGSEDDSFPDSDTRTILRRMVLPHVAERVSAWITLDSSKSADPPVLFFRWTMTEYGPAPEIVVAQPQYADLTWRQLKKCIGAARAQAKAETRDAKTEADVDQVVEAVRNLEVAGTYATARAIKDATGRSQDWTATRLAAARAAGRLVATPTTVPRCHGPVHTYHVASAADHD